MDSTILVAGTAEIRVHPDLARLRVVLDERGAQREATLSALVAAARAVDAVLEEAAPALGAVTGSAASVHPTTRWRKGEQQRTGWTASRTTVVEVTSFAVLGQLLSDLAAAGATEVHGPAWEVSPTNPSHAAARSGAARDARERAAAYADGLGVTVGPVAWVAEPGLRRGHDDELMPLAYAAAGGGAQADETFDVAPAEQTVTARVEVAFTLGPPTTANSVS